jgi:hypothetical protein
VLENIAEVGQLVRVVLEPGERNVRLAEAPAGRKEALFRWKWPGLQPVGRLSK